ncbi:hypothetical protein STEG23_029787 [Scotinomys teguina]
MRYFENMKNWDAMSPNVLYVVLTNVHLQELPAFMVLLLMKLKLKTPLMVPLPRKTAALRTESRMCRLSWFLDPGGWGKAAAVRLYFIFPEICTLSLIMRWAQTARGQSSPSTTEEDEDEEDEDDDDEYVGSSIVFFLVYKAFNLPGHNSLLLKEKKKLKCKAV